MIIIKRIKLYNMEKASDVGVSFTPYPTNCIEICHSRSGILDLTIEKIVTYQQLRTKYINLHIFYIRIIKLLQVVVEK